MNNGKTSLIKLVTAIVFAAFALGASAQNWYDDDIYYNASKDKKQKKETKKSSTDNGVYNYNSANVDEYYTPSSYTIEYRPADNSNLGAGSNFDVDAYNRYGQFLVPDSVAADTSMVDDFTYTRRIERFYNPDVVKKSGDADLVKYYNQPASSDINIYVNAYPTFSSPYWYSAFNNPWYYDPFYYDPWYRWNYGYTPWYRPGFSFGWNIGWGWNWNWSWAWGPTWGPAWGPGPAIPPRPYPGGPSHAWRPGVNPGQSAVHRPVSGGINSSNPANRPGSTTTQHGYSRPGNMGQPTTGNSRPAVSTGTTRPGSSGNIQNTPSSRPGSVVTSPTPSGNTNNSGSNTRGRGNYNSGSSNSNSGWGGSHSSGGTFRSSGGSGGTFGGSRNSAGGGGGRGRR